MRALTKREWYIALALGGCLFIWLAISLARSYSETKDELGEKTGLLVKKIRRNQQMISQEPQINETLNLLKGRLGKAASDGAESAAIIKMAEQAAMANNIHLVNIQPRRTSAQGQLKGFTVEMTFDGQWAAFNDFIQSLQASPNFLDIESLQLEKFSDTTSSLRGVLVLKRWRINN